MLTELRVRFKFDSEHVFTLKEFDTLTIHIGEQNIVELILTDDELVITDLIGKQKDESA